MRDGPFMVRRHEDHMQTRHCAVTWQVTVSHGLRSWIQLRGTWLFGEPHLALGHSRRIVRHSSELRLRHTIHHYTSMRVSWPSFDSNGVTIVTEDLNSLLVCLPQSYRHVLCLSLQKPLAQQRRDLVRD